VATATDDMKQRTRAFALRTLRLSQALPKGRIGEVLARQLLRSGTSVGANYRAACRARSHADFIAKMGIVEEELDESLYWMDLILQESLVTQQRLGPLMKEADELLSMTVASVKTARSNRRGEATRKSALRTRQSAI